MIHPALAAEVARALEAWATFQGRRGADMPDGWTALCDLVAAAARQPDADDEPEWLTLEQACDRAGISTSTLYRWRHDGLPEHRVRGRVLIAPADLDAWVVRSSSGQSSVRTGHGLAAPAAATDGASTPHH